MTKPDHFKEIEKCCASCSHVSYPYTDRVWCNHYEFYISDDDDGGNTEDYSVCDTWSNNGI